MNGRQSRGDCHRPSDLIIGLGWDLVVQMPGGDSSVLTNQGKDEGRIGGSSGSGSGSGVY